jgi:hypothetical protein
MVRVTMDDVEIFPGSEGFAGLVRLERSPIPQGNFLFGISGRRAAEFGPRNRIGTRKESDLVPPGYEAFGENRDEVLDRPLPLGGHLVVKCGNLRNPHGETPIEVGVSDF